MSTDPKSKAAKTKGTPAEIDERDAPAKAALLFLGVGVVGICVLCGTAWYLFHPHVTDEPAAVAPLMDELLDVDVPAMFEPRGTIQWNVAFVMSLRGAYYESADAARSGLLMFLEVGGGSLDKPDVRAHVEQVLKEQGNDPIELVPEGISDDRLVSIRGEAVLFTFETATDPATQTKYRLIHGVVDGKGGEVLIALRVQAGPGWDDAVAVGMLESIR